MSEQYVPANEAMKLLNMPSATFYRLVKEGKITKYKASALSSHGQYAVKELTGLKRHLQETAGEPTEHPAVDWLTTADLGNLYNLEYEAFQPELENPALIRRWLAYNPHVGRILYNQEQRRDLWGAIVLLPLREEVIMQLLRGEIQDTAIVAERDLVTDQQTGAIDLYVASVIIQPERRRHLAVLLKSWFDYWYEQAPDRYIGRIYTRAQTEPGELLVRKLFFSPIWHVSDDAYMLDLSRPNPSRLVRTFQERLRARS